MLLLRIEYVRDKRSPKPKDETVSRVMSANKAKGSGPEVFLRKALYKENLTGYRLHYKRAPGRPDICFVSKKLAIFVHGCYWHRCPQCNYPIPKTNPAFWNEKFRKNKDRDKRKVRELRLLGWRVLTIWECSLKKRPESVIKQVKKTLAL